MRTTVKQKALALQCGRITHLKGHAGPSPDAAIEAAVFSRISVMTPSER
jgi:hypothetical protein